MRWLTEGEPPEEDGGADDDSFEVASSECTAPPEGSDSTTC